MFTNFNYKFSGDYSIIGYKKQKIPPKAGFEAADLRKLSAGNLAGTQAAGANCNRLVRAINNSLNFSDVRLPHSVGRTVGVGNLSAENNALTANTALSHVYAPPCI